MKILVDDMAYSHNDENPYDVYWDLAVADGWPVSFYCYGKHLDRRFSSTIVFSSRKVNTGIIPIMFFPRAR